MRRLLIVLALLFVSGDGGAVILISGGGAAPSCPGSHNFNSGDLACFTQRAATWNIVSSELKATADAVPNINILYNPTTPRGADQWVVWKWRDEISLGHGAIMRADGAGVGYMIWLWDANSEIQWAYTDNDCDDVTTIQAFFGLALTPNDHMAAKITGTGASTNLKVWICTAGDPGDYVSDAAWDSACGTADIDHTEDPATDATAVDAAGDLGICSIGGMTNARYDNFRSGDV